MPTTTENILLVLTNPLPGREEEFNRWYTDVHLDEVLEYPGFVSARRFKLTGQINVTGFGSSEHSYLALYEIDGDPEAALAHISAEIESGQLAVTEAIDPGVLTAGFTAITDTVREQGATGAAVAS